MWAVFVAVALTGIGFFLWAAMAEAKTTSEAKQAWPWRHPLDHLFWEFSRRSRNVAAILKALATQESSLTPDAINPESKSWKPSEVKQHLIAGTDGGRGFLVRTKLNPSIGLLQIRWSTAKKLEPSVNPVDLFYPRTNVSIGAKLLFELLRAKITIDTIDAWNVGQDLTPRNIPYRDRVRGFYQAALRDFPADGEDVT